MCEIYLKNKPKGRKGLLLKRHLNIPFELVNKSSQNYILRGIIAWSHPAIPTVL